MVRMRSPVRIRVAAPNNPEAQLSLGALAFIELSAPTMPPSGGCLELLLSLRPGFTDNFSTNSVLRTMPTLPSSPSPPYSVGETGSQHSPWANIRVKKCAPRWGAFLAVSPLNLSAFSYSSESPPLSSLLLREKVARAERVTDE